jgi:uncharacterized protein YaeQ
MALPSAVRTMNLDISDVDRGVYESVEFRLPQHPSETGEFFVTRILAYALHWTEHLAFGPGLQDPDEPSMSETDTFGRLSTWIDIGAPAADRLHRATKRAENVIIVSHRSRREVETELGKRKIHRGDTIQIQLLPDRLTGPLADSLGRKNHWQILKNDGALHVTVGEESFTGEVELVASEAG